MPSSNCASGSTSKENDSWDSNRYNTPLFTEVLFTAARGQNNPNVDRQMNRSRNFVMHFRKGESLSLAATWMNPEDIMLSKIKQTQRVKHYMI